MKDFMWDFMWMMIFTIILLSGIGFLIADILWIVG